LLDKLFSFFSTKKCTQFSDFDKRRREKINSKIEELIGIRPKKELFYIKAFTHRSFLNDQYLKKDKKKLSNIVSDCLEALIAAIYLDLGEKTASKFIIEHIIDPQVISGTINDDKNYKGQLLEFSHANKLNQPIYKIIDQIGPQHDKIYSIEVYIDDKISGIGKGPNKKLAEQLAAKAALKLANQIVINSE